MDKWDVHDVVEDDDEEEDFCENDIVDVGVAE